MLLLLQAGAVAAAPLLRAYIGTRRRLHATVAVVHNCAVQIVRMLSFGALQPPYAFHVTSPESCSRDTLRTTIVVCVNWWPLRKLADIVLSGLRLCVSMAPLFLPAFAQGVAHRARPD